MTKNYSAIDMGIQTLYGLDTNIGGCVMEAYCFKCRTKRTINNPQAVTLKNGRPATQGACPTCGTKVFRIGKSQS